MTELSTECEQAVDNFHKLYYENEPLWFKDTTWMGVPVRKLPSDLMIFQELVWRTRPDVIIETGTALGGSALFFASMLDMLGETTGSVITVDIERHCGNIGHERVTQIIGSSADPDVIKQVNEVVSRCCPMRGIMVILDSCHEKDHVLAEMDAYAHLVTSGGYMVVEDTNINGNPVYPAFGPGPKEAVDEWLPNHPEFVIDRDVEKYMFTFHPGGWLRKR